MLTGNDRRFGPVTFGSTDSWSPLRLVYSSGGGDEGDKHNSLTAYAFGWAVRIWLPNIIPPWRRKIQAQSWDAATVARMGRDWYYDEHPREYGFSLSEGFFTLFLGAQTGDSTTTQDWSCFVPWSDWRFVRLSLYAPDGSHFWTERAGTDTYEKQQACPSVQFDFHDFDGERITATCRIEEREWRFGSGWFCWLSVFRRAKIRRSLDLRFSSEVGRKKGSWKGGTTGHGIDMERAESPESAFRRYCDTYDLTPVASGA